MPASSYGTSNATGSAASPSIRCSPMIPPASELAVWSTSVTTATAWPDSVTGSAAVIVPVRLVTAADVRATTVNEPSTTIATAMAAASVRFMNRILRWVAGTGAPGDGSWTGFREDRRQLVAGLIAEQRRQVGAADRAGGVVHDAEFVDRGPVGEEAQVHDLEDRLARIDPAAAGRGGPERAGTAQPGVAVVRAGILAGLGRNDRPHLRQVRDGCEGRLLTVERRQVDADPGRSVALALLELAERHLAGERQLGGRVGVRVPDRGAIDEHAALVGAVPACRAVIGSRRAERRPRAPARRRGGRGAPGHGKQQGGERRRRLPGHGMGLLARSWERPPGITAVHQSGEGAGVRTWRGHADPRGCPPARRRGRAGTGGPLGPSAVTRSRTRPSCRAGSCGRR